MEPTQDVSRPGPSDAAIAEATEVLRQAVMAGRYEGIVCPTCDQMAKVYRRKITGASVRSMANMYATHGREFVHMPSLRKRAENGEAKLRYWGLVESMNAVRPDGGHAGYWRVTEKGEDWLLGKLAVEKYALIYNGDLLGLDDSDGFVTPQECLSNDFDLSELMAGI